MQKTQINLSPPVDACSECSGTHFVFDREIGETVCGTCGLVLTDQMMDLGPEWRAYTHEEEKSRRRVGSATSHAVFDKGLSTMIRPFDRDASGRKLPLSTRLKMWRLRKWQIRSRVQSNSERNLAKAMSELDRLSDKLNIHGSIKENAAVIYRKAFESGLVQGRTIAGVMAASLYAACRTSETPRRLREIAAASLIRQEDIARCYRLLLRELQLQVPLADPLTYVSKIAESVGLSGEVQGLAIQILRDAREARVSSGKDPSGLAAAALYLACRQSKTKRAQKDIAAAAGVTEVTVRNRYKTLKQQLSLELLD